MKGLFTYRNLFLVFILGLLLQLGGSVGQISSTWNSTGFFMAETARLLGLLLMVISPILLLLKFFSRLDQQA